jgi:GntR family transcriptional regulator
LSILVAMPTTPGPCGEQSHGESEGGKTRNRSPSDAPSPPLSSLCFFDQRFERINIENRRVGFNRQHYFTTMTITMLHVNIDRDEPELLHDQVAAELRRAIAEGEAQPGERLPPAKDLAAVLEVNVNTVLRALRLLRDEGLVEFRRGRGVSVTGTPDRSVVLSQARELLELGRRFGYRREDVIGIIRGLP